MTIYYSLIAALWLIFIAVWVISAFGAKKNVRSRRWLREVGLRLIVIAVIVLAVRLTGVRHALHRAQGHLFNTDPVLGLAGVVLCALGIGLAIYARFYLGSNWGMPMSRKENPELVTSGPYAYIRHPIYSGLLLAVIGSAIAESIVFLLPLVLAGIYIIYSARVEERTMAETFPETYPAYRKRTKMIVPFLF